MKNIKPIELFAINEKVENKYGHEFLDSSKLTKEVLETAADKLKKIAKMDNPKTEFKDIDGEFNLAYNTLSRLQSYIEALRVYILKRNLEDNYPSYEEAMQDAFADVVAKKQDVMDWLKQL